MSSERRRFSRIPFRVKAEMTADDAFYSVDSIDSLSVGGCLLPIKADIKLGTGCNVRILLTGTSSELVIRIDGEINRCTPEGVAIKFTRIDPDSLIHLQNIILYNSPDSHLVEKEIHDHPGLV